MITGPRIGERPAVSTDGPQRQLTQRAAPELWGRLFARVFELPGVVEGHSQVSSPSSRAVFFADTAITDADTWVRYSAQTSLAPRQRQEPVHLHGVLDTSVHVCLPASRGSQLTNLGWAQPHSHAEFGTEFLVYGPRTPREVDVVLSIIEESLAWARGGRG